MKHVRALRTMVSVACLAALPALPGAAWAQAPVPQTKKAGDAERVEALIEQGIALRKTGSDAEALALFQRAEQLEPDSVRLQVHLAATHQALGEWEAADRYLSRALAQPKDPFIVKHQATLAAARRTIDSHIGTLEVMGQPAGAEVRLDGRLLGTLPRVESERLAAGIYSLEVTLPGHFPVTRSVALAGGQSARETVALAPMAGAPSTTPAPVASAVTAPDEAPRREREWLTWTLAGASAASTIAAVAFWREREAQADRWNDNERCQGGGQTRGALCGDTLDQGERAETWLIVTGTASLAFAAGAVVNHLMEPSRPAPVARDALTCGVGPGSVACAGRF